MPGRLHVTRRSPVDHDPPYDDESPFVVDGSLALAPLPAGRPFPLQLVRPDADNGFGAVRTPRHELSAPGPRAAVLARAVLEVVSGDRPVAQLMRWTTPDVYDELAVSVAPRGPRPWAATLRRLLVCEPVPGVAEVTAVVDRGPRSGALALRLEGVDGRWLVTAMQLG